MRIYFNNLDIFTKNAKRVHRSIKDLKLNDPQFQECQEKISLSQVQNHLSKVYGYSSFNELRRELSPSEPQLDDLDNDKELWLENQITEVFGDFFSDIGMRKDLAYTLANGISFYLQYHCKDTKKKIKYPDKYYGYKDMARAFGMTTPAFKKVLVANNDLVGTIPTYKAIIENRAKTWIVDYPGRPVGLKVVWSESYIDHSFANKGIRITSEFQWLQVPTSLHGANTNLERLAKALREVIEPERDRRKEKGIGDYSLSEWEVLCMHIEHPITHWATWEPKAERSSYLRGYFVDLIAEARRIDSAKTDEIESVIEKVIAWVARYKGPYT